MKNALLIQNCGWTTGHLAPVDPRHLIFSIWSTTQHYADFSAQVEVLLDTGSEARLGAEEYLMTLFTRLLRP